MSCNGKISGIVLVAFISLTCSSKTSLPPKNGADNKSPDVIHRKCTIEILEENPAATSRQIFAGELGKPVEIHTQYKNGDTGVEYLEESSGRVKECKEIFSSGATKSHAVFDRDGKTFLKGELYRPDGSLCLVRELTKKGYYKSSFYLPQAKFPYLSEEQISIAEAQRDIFLPDGTLRAKVALSIASGEKPAIINETVYFTSDKKMEHKVVYYSGKVSRRGLYSTSKVYWYREDGSLSFLQEWMTDYLNSVIEYGLDGKTIERAFNVDDMIYLNKEPNIRIITPHMLEKYKNDILVARSFFAYSVSIIEKMPLQLVDPGFERQDLGFHRDKIFFVNMPVVLERTSNTRPISKNYSPEDGVYEEFDIKLFKYFRDSELDARWIELVRESDEYLGMPLGKEDLCRSWYLNRLFRWQAFQM